MNEYLLNVYKKCIVSDAMNFLELGVDTGYSMRKWKSICPPKTKLYGIDISFNNLKISPSEFILFQENILDKNKIDDILRGKTFDLIIHDAIPTENLKVFSIFHPFLSNRGKMIMENFRPKNQKYMACLST